MLAAVDVAVVLQNPAGGSPGSGLNRQLRTPLLLMSLPLQPLAGSRGTAETDPSPGFGRGSQQRVPAPLHSPAVVAPSHTTARLGTVLMPAGPMGTHTAVIRSSWKVTKAISSRFSVMRLRSALNSSVSFSSSSP